MPHTSFAPGSDSLQYVGGRNQWLEEVSVSDWQLTELAAIADIIPEFRLEDICPVERTRGRRLRFLQDCMELAEELGDYSLFDEMDTEEF